MLLIPGHGGLESGYTRPAITHITLVTTQYCIRGTDFSARASFRFPSLSYSSLLSAQKLRRPRENSCRVPQFCCCVFGCHVEIHMKPEFLWRYLAVVAGNVEDGKPIRYTMYLCILLCIRKSTKQLFNSTLYMCGAMYNVRAVSYLNLYMSLHVQSCISVLCFVSNTNHNNNILSKNPLL